MNIPLSPCVPENLVSRDGFSRPVPRQPAHLHTQAESGAYLLTGFLPSSAAASIYETAIYMPSGQSRAYRVTQLRTDGVHCRESAGTGPVNLKVVPNECCLGTPPWTNQYSPLFPTPTIGMKWACGKYRGTGFPIMVVVTLGQCCFSHSACWLPTRKNYFFTRMPVAPVAQRYLVTL